MVLVNNATFIHVINLAFAKKDWIADKLTGIRTWYLPNARLNCYFCADLIGSKI